MKEIDSWMRHIWKEVVKKEYDNGMIFEESNLHSTVYFHLRKLTESSKGKKTKLFLYSEMPFSRTMSGEGKRNPRVDLAIVILDRKKEAPIDLLAVIELKHYDYHAKSVGIQKDLDHLEALQKGTYYPYKPTKKLVARTAYFLYLVDKGKISFDSTLQRKIKTLKKNGYLKVFLGYGDKCEFIIQQ